MKQSLGCLVIVLGVFLVFLLVFEQVLVKQPEPLREDTPGVFDSPEAVLDTYFWATNHKDYQTYQECHGYSGNVEVTTDIDYDIDLWPTFYEYEITSTKRYSKLVILEVLENYESSGGDFTTSKYHENHRTKYYFMERNGRWVMVDESIELTIEVVKNVIWSLWDR